MNEEVKFVDTFVPLKFVIKRLKYKYRNKGPFLKEVWEDIIPEELKKRTKFVRYKQGKVVINVESPSLLQNILFYNKRALLEELRKKSNIMVEDIVFRVGKI